VELALLGFIYIFAIKIGNGPGLTQSQS